MKKVCITGITGQVGSVLCKRFLKEGFKVFSLDTSKLFYPERIKSVQLAIKTYLIK